MFYDPEIARFLSRDMVLRRGGNPYSYAQANPLAYVDPLGLWEESGHFYTTYIVARAAGLDKQTAFDLAYYSQLPDEVADFDAVEQVKAYVAENLIASRALAKGVDWEKCRPGWHERNKYRIDINQLLHSLHGGDVKARRAALKELVMDKSLSTQERGIIIHAYGDSYAHTFTDNGELKAYGWPWGHLKPSVSGKSPDTILKNREAYVEYVDELFSAFGGKPKDQGNLAELGLLLKRLAEKPGRDQNEAFEKLARESYGYDFAYSPLPGMETDKAKDNLDRDKMRQIMDRIAKECSSK